MKSRLVFAAQIALSVLLISLAASFAQPPRAVSKQEWSSPRVVGDLLEDRLATESIIPGEVIVKLKEGVAPAAVFGATGDAESLQRTSGGELVLRLTGEEFVTLSDENKARQTVELVERLGGRDDVEYVQPNYLLQIVNIPNDPLFRLQWSYFDSTAGIPDGGIGLPSTWDVTTGAPEVVVAVIDTGIVGEHPDIVGSPNLLHGFDMISDPIVAADGNGRDLDPIDPGDGVRRGECGTDVFGGPVPSRDLPDSWHGSHVAGTVGVGQTNNNVGIAGMNWNVHILPVRALGKCGGSTADINDAIRWAAGLPVPGAPDNSTPAQIINLSLGGRGACTSSPATQRAIDDAIAAGVTVVVAAGNESEDASKFTPASCDGVITVAAADRRGYLALRYSNFGDRVDILAPGGDVRRDDDGDGQPDGILSYVRGAYDLYNGTSMAAPHVAGVAALLKARRPELTPAQIKDELQRHARPRTSIECPRACGAGLLDARFLSTGEPSTADKTGKGK